MNTAGAVIDGAWAVAQALRRVNDGTLTRAQAAKHVVLEVCTGAASTAAGAGSAALLVALTGGVAAPAVFMVGAVAAIGAKAGLDGYLGGLAGAIRVTVVTEKGE
jgi:hypothetical protein